MTYSNRIFLYGPVVLLLLIAAAVMVNWKLAADSFDARLTADNGHEIMPGVWMSYGSKEMEGFPFRLDSVMDGFTLQVQMRTGPLVWHAEQFAIHALTYGRNQQIFEAAGTQTLSWTDSDGVHRRWSFVPGSLRASAILADGRLSRFDLDAVAIASPELSATRLQFHMRHAPSRDALDIVVNGDRIRLAPILRPGMGDEIREVNLSGTVSPSLPFQSLLSGQSDWRAATEDWRRREGRLTVSRFDLAWGTIRGHGRLDLRLDQTHRLEGNINTQLTGVGGVTSDSRNSEWLMPRIAAALRDLSPSAQQGDPGAIEAWFQIYSGGIYLNADNFGNSKPSRVQVLGRFGSLGQVSPLY
jgi:hypothetical protein